MIQSNVSPDVDSSIEEQLQRDAIDESNIERERLRECEQRMHRIERQRQRDERMIHKCVTTRTETKIDESRTRTIDTERETLIVERVNENVTTRTHTIRHSTTTIKS